MRITNVHNEPREIVATGVVVAPGEDVEVDDDLGKSLCEQPANWQVAKSTKKEN